MRPTIAKIYLKNFEHNINIIKKHIGNKKICVPVKADGYGHGDVQIAKKCEELGIDYLAVATVDEALHLRKNKINLKILLLGIPQFFEIPDIIKANVECFAFDEEYINQLNTIASQNNTKIGIHLKIDTGMGRLGCNCENCVKIASLIANSSNLELKGVCTHFSVSDSLKQEDINYTNHQIQIFKHCIDNIKNNGINPGIIHGANSGAVLMYEDAWFDMVRPGIICYGFAPDIEQYQQIINNKEFGKLKPLFELETCVSSIINHKKGDSISYGRTWICEEDTCIAVLPIGYADGFFRRFNNNISVKINDKIYPQVGRICMDQCMINIGNNHNVKIGDKVTIFSVDSNEESLSIELLAQKTNTISYEILCGISKRVPRIYIN